MALKGAHHYQDPLPSATDSTNSCFCSPPHSHPACLTKTAVPPPGLGDLCGMGSCLSLCLDPCCSPVAAALLKDVTVPCTSLGSSTSSPAQGPSSCGKKCTRDLGRKGFLLCYPESSLKLLLLPAAQLGLKAEQGTGVQQQLGKASQPRGQRWQPRGILPKLRFQVIPLLPAQLFFPRYSCLCSRAVARANEKEAFVKYFL